MRTLPFLVGAMWLAHAASAAAQTSPAEARARLDVLLGSWTLAGQEDAYSETCEWYPNKSFVVCNSEEKSPQGVSKGVSVIGYSELSGMYTYYNYGSSGGSRMLNGFLRGDEFVFTGERPVRGNMVRYQVSIRPMSSGFAFREERSTNGAPWVTAMQADYIRRK
jgi:hypothetical protein